MCLIALIALVFARQVIGQALGIKRGPLRP